MSKLKDINHIMDQIDAVNVEIAHHDKIIKECNTLKSTLRSRINDLMDECGVKQYANKDRIVRISSRRSTSVVDMNKVLDYFIERDALDMLNIKLPIKVYDAAMKSSEPIPGILIDTRSTLTYKKS